jgi:hypothetical protein
MSLALRNLCLTLALTIGALALVGYVWKQTGYEMLIVAMGWPHVVLGFLFYFGKVLRGEGNTRSIFLLLALLTLALWAAHYAYTITGFISIYFTYHVFRDEVFIYFQTRARHKLRGAVTVAGFIPFILLMFLVTDPRPQHYRQNLRRVELTGAQLSANGWTLVSFKPISYSGGQDFYFYLQAPQTAGATPYNLLATAGDTRNDGEVRVADKRWSPVSDLDFKPYYAGDSESAPVETPAKSGPLKIALSGDYRLGQTFKVERDNLAGIWLRTLREGNEAQATSFVFHLTPDTSPPIPPLSPLMQILRFALILILLALVLWKALPELKSTRAFWGYFIFLVATFAALQAIIKWAGGAGFDAPVMFQMVVVFHYWSWYVFSLNKLRANEDAATHAPTPASLKLYDRMLRSFGSVPNFLMLVVALNLLSIAGVIWYNKLDAPAALRYVFDYKYFLYFLVFHVTFSFSPKQTTRRTAAK